MHIYEYRYIIKETKGFQMKLLKLTLASLVFASAILADTANIAAASDLQYAFKEMQSLFAKKYPTETINFQFGSSGKALTQIQSGAPYDAYFAADMNYPKQLKEKGLAVGDVKPYALGRVGLMVLKSSKIPLNDLSILSTDRIKKIAIANPEHAPYGQAAVAALKTLGLYDKIKSKFVYGENIQQTTQYVQTGAADAGIIALSIAKAPIIADQINFALIDGKTHPDILQGYALLKRGENNKAARAFLLTVESPEGDAIMKKYGFIIK
jgi:molybdate transport system substrate-binding protein